MTELRDAVAAAKEFLEWMPSYDDEIIQVIRVEDVEDAVAAAIAAWNRRADDWQDIETCPLDVEGLVWVADGGNMQLNGKRAGRIAFGRVSVYADLPRRAYASGYNGDWLITAWRPLPKGPGG